MRNTLIVIGIILLIFWGIGLIFKVIGVAINALLVIGLFLIVLSLIKGKNKRIDQGRNDF
ncbi:DUF5670 family protein [Albibacterium bauzanense]|uniref:Uncharacterized protein n=1 Tax=Albibacterium bauzanense TaxID=653929 RepID=A0A4R1M1B5_9SPHI|nr:DUF5670 family protein [Albibacterium bauzanense]TCK85746.1 hypothetical protein C8N28_1059 [Albibacterium bauzanense]